MDSAAGVSASPIDQHPAVPCSSICSAGRSGACCRAAEWKSITRAVLIQAGEETKLNGIKPSWIGSWCQFILIRDVTAGSVRAPGPGAAISHRQRCPSAGAPREVGLPGTRWRPSGAGAEAAAAGRSAQGSRMQMLTRSWGLQMAGGGRALAEQLKLLRFLLCLLQPVFIPLPLKAVTIDFFSFFFSPPPPLLSFLLFFFPFGRHIAVTAAAWLPGQGWSPNAASEIWGRFRLLSSHVNVISRARRSVTP